MKKIDIAVIGAGPAGLSAAGYAARAGYGVTCFDQLAPGGQLLLIDEIENYPGYGLAKGFQLAEQMENQATGFGVDIEYAKVLSIRKEENVFILDTEEGQMEARSVIAATGATHRHLGAKGEEEFQGRGVSYCATCDGPFFKGKDIVVVGGGDTALTDALYLAKLANTVTIVHRRNEFRGQKVLSDRVRAASNIRLALSRQVVEIASDDGSKVSRAVLDDGSSIACDAVFIFVGITPNSGIFEGFCELDKNGFIVTDGRMETSVPGFFAAGDVRNTSFRQVVTAAGDGAMAAHMADEYLSSLSK